MDSIFDIFCLENMFVSQHAVRILASVVTEYIQMENDGC
jgi:hypothetical protein